MPAPVSEKINTVHFFPLTKDFQMQNIKTGWMRDACKAKDYLTILLGWSNYQAHRE